MVGQQKGGNVRLGQDVGQLVSAIGRVDIDQDRANRGRGKLSDDPLRPVGGPDANVLSARHAQGKQSAGQAANLRVEVAVTAAVVQPREDEGVMIGEASCRFGEHLREGQTLNRRGFHSGHGSSSPGGRARNAS